MDTRDFCFPVLRMGTRGSVQVCVDESVLNTLNMATFKAETMVGSIIVDSNGTAAKVEGVRFVSGKGSFGGWTLMLERLIEVEYELGKPYRMSLEDVRARLLKFMRRTINPELNAEAWAEEMRKVGGAETIADTIAIVLPHFNVCAFWQAVKKH